MTKDTEPQPENATPEATGENVSEECASEQCSCAGEAGESPCAGTKGGSCCADAPLPKPTFSTFVISLASSALVQLGEVPEPESGKIQENLQLAKHTIDILSMLQDKITNGLDDGEKRLMEGILYELRMKYVVKKQ